MTDTFVADDLIDQTRLTSTTRRKFFIETEARTSTMTKQLLTSNSTISSRSVHDILENTKSPTDGLPKTTYTYAQSLSYMPVAQHASYAVPVMARRDLRSDYQNVSSNNNSAFSSPTKFISNVRTQLVNSYSAIRNRLIHHEQDSTRKNLLSSPTRKKSEEIYENSTSTIHHLRRRAPVHSTPRDVEFEQNSRSINTEQQEMTVNEPILIVQQPRDNILMRIIKTLLNVPFQLIKYSFGLLFSLPWWIIFPLAFLFGFFVIPQLICRPFEESEHSQINQQCRYFHDYRNNLTKQTLHVLRHETFKDLSEIYEKTSNLKRSTINWLKEFDVNRMNFFRTNEAENFVEPISISSKSCCEPELNEIHRLIGEIKEQQEIYLGRSTTLSVDQENELKNFVRRLIDQYAADETGRADYALEANGAKIIDTRCTEYTDEPRQNVVKFFGIPIVHMSKQPENMIRAGRLPGQCFPFKGDQGSVVIKLAVPVKPTEFILEHLSKDLSIVGHISSAPNNFTVFSLVDKNDKEGKVLGRYFYDAENGPSIQRFKPQLVNVPLVEYIEVRVASNWGNPSYTCLYRFRVHGDLKTVQSAS